ncbi:restriction endonuclease subunit S [Rufibacter roseolus]|uniref:restriction endonuclease subunit S n=1 Tax=Rufibacter roseolus TaxID=2817375 RepID=UPI001B30A359|nr:restriction endonuclease subunit S [Rufibacter roseolus]
MMEAEVEEIVRVEKNVPILRFPEFEEEWETRRLGELITIKSGVSPANYKFGEEALYPFIKVEDLNNCIKYQVSSRFFTDSSKNLVAANSIIFPKRGAAILNNKIRINSSPLLMDSNLMALTPVEKAIHYEFLFYRILKEELYKIADTSTIPQINNKHIEPYKIRIPNYNEQAKVASFISVIDDKIQQLTKKKGLLEEYKKGVMQQIFSQKIQFKDENGQDFPEWEEKNGNVLFENISDKNHNSDLPILAITQEHGAIPREMIDYNISVTDKSVESYKVVQAGDFIISLRSFQGGIEYSSYKGLCSPAYIILRPKQDINRDFFKFYFKTENYISLLNTKLEGIRDGKMISYKYFSDIKLPLPSLPEQNKIAHFFTSINSKVDLVTNQLEQAKKFKKGLLEQMFV